VGVDGVSRITDFGIAKCLSENTAETTQGIVKGKIAYMAPEQVRGEPLDRRADVFALGVMAWELLTGERLFRGTNDADSISRVIGLTPKPPSEVERAVPAELDAIVLRALAKTSGERTASAAAFAAELLAAARPRVASSSDVARWVWSRAGAEIEHRRGEIALAEAGEPTADIATAELGPPAPAPTARRWRATAAVVSVVSVVSVVAVVAGVGAFARLRGRPPEPRDPDVASVRAPSDALSAERAATELPPAPEAPGPATSGAPATSAAPERTTSASHAGRHHRTSRPTTSSSGPARFKAPPNPYQ
jgi:serine/threonine-protein kinase